MVDELASTVKRIPLVYWFAVIGILLVLIVVIRVPQLQAALYIDLGRATLSEYPGLVNENRKTLLQVIGGLVVLVGLYLTHRRIRVTEDGQVTDRFTKAIEQLGSDKISIRLGGIYALERIAKDSRKDHWTVIEVLSAFVREGPPIHNREGIELSEAGVGISTDIQAALTVVDRRKHQQDPENTPINYSTANLQGSNLEGAFLREANLNQANLNQANLGGVNLEGAFLGGAFLREAHLSGVNLQGAFLQGANLQWAYLSGANLQGANLEGTNLQGAILQGANLLWAKLQGANLSRADLQGAILQGANLQGAKLYEANLQGTILEDAQIPTASGTDDDGTDTKPK